VSFRFQARPASAMVIPGSVVPVVAIVRRENSLRCTPRWPLST
jgi:hypothetical protein